MHPHVHQMFIMRCIRLARLGLGRVSPNPLVGAVLVYDGQIIGEGYHAYYGGPHAEVMAVASVQPAHRPYISQSTLYVSLEPCCVYGKTPPCTNLILAERIPRVIISQLDHSPGVDGGGVQLLRDAGVEVITDVLPEAGLRLSLPRQVFATAARPYVMLKYAQSRDGFMAPAQPGAYWLTNGFSRRLTHRWRGHTDAILIGGATALADDPALTTRLYPGKSPCRIVLEYAQQLPASLQVFDEQAPTWVFSQRALAAAYSPDLPAHVRIFPFDFHESQWPQRLMARLYAEKIAHLTVEGGARILHTFIDADLWDEARVFTAPCYLHQGLRAPVLPQTPENTSYWADDRLDQYYRPASLAAFQ